MDWINMAAALATLLAAAFTTKDWWLPWMSRKEKREAHARGIASRVIHVFEAHGVHRNQIPRFFGHGLTLEDVQRDECLLPKLTDALLEEVCKTFALRREWLDGADENAYEVHCFYKHPEDFASFIDDLKAENPDGVIDGVVIAPVERVGEARALLVLEEQVGWVGDTPIFRYHLCDEWVFSYWKCRAYLAACVAIAWRKQIYLQGVTAKSKDVRRLVKDATLMAWRSAPISRIGQRWYPEDMCLKPEVFLNGIDPEHQRYGVRAGLALWLDLHSEGWMETGLSMYEQSAVRALFEHAAHEEA